jgi:hypothetical protein
MKGCFSFCNRLLQLPLASQRLRQECMQIGIGWRQRDRLAQLCNRVVYPSRQPVSFCELLMSVGVSGPLLNSAFKKIRSLLRLIALKSQAAQVEKGGEVMGIDLESSAKFSFRSFRVTFALQGGAKPAVHRRVGRTLRKHGTKLLLGAARLIMLQVGTGEIETGIAGLGMCRNVLQEDPLRLLPVSGVLQCGAEFIQCPFIAGMQRKGMPIWRCLLDLDIQTRPEHHSIRTA